MGDKSSGEGPPPPSPLTGAYLLIVLPQTHLPQHKDNVLHNLTKGLITWDKDDCHVDLEKELETITSQAPEGEEAKNGERLIQFASENLVTEVLIHPQLNTLVQCMRNLLSSFTRHRHIIHAGYTCVGNGAWMVQDGTYSFADFADMYAEHEVQRVLRAYENTVTVDVHCCQEGDWNNLRGKDPFSKISRVRLNPNDKMTANKSIHDFLDYLGQYVVPASVNELLEASDVVGNIRFSHPTLYVFPGGQGDAALFGINGFNMLVDGGFARKACFWDFSRHLDRLDAVLMTRINNGNIQGMSSLLQKKRVEQVYPQIGHFFCNLQERRHPLSPDGDKDRDPLLVNLFEKGQDMLAGLRQLQLKPQMCYRDPTMEPINLYHKVGHGKLDMYVISPAKDSREVREFMAKWASSDSKIFCSFAKRGGEFSFPMSNKVSICALLVWQPANPEDNITRILFPGSTPQHKIFEGLDKLKNVEFLKHAVCSARSLSPSSSVAVLNAKNASKSKAPLTIEKIAAAEEAKRNEAVKSAVKLPDKVPVKPQPPVRQVKSKSVEKPKDKPKTETETKIETVKIDKPKQTEAVQKVDKPKEKPKKLIQKQVDKPSEKKAPQRSAAAPSSEKKPDSLKSSPTTPKKVAENKILDAKPEMKPRASTRTKPSPSSTPAKSAKEANNRKVVEQKSKEAPKKPPVKKEDAKKTSGPKKTVVSPARTGRVSPAKGKAPVKAKQQEVKKVTKPEKEATDSMVSTPSTADIELVKAKEDAAEKESKPEEGKLQEDKSDLPISKEEDEILIIEKIEIEGAKPETIAVHLESKPVEEDVVAQPKPAEDHKVPAEIPDVMQTSVEMISKSKIDSQETFGGVKDLPTDKLSTPKEKSNELDPKNLADESQPDEKFSTTVESGATTAPTLPEDERITLDDAKEKEGAEEKHVKEETKEKEPTVAALARPEQPTSLPEVVPVVARAPFDQRVLQLKDIVKTPDEVADLPVHEVADGGLYQAGSKEDLLEGARPATEQPVDEEMGEESKVKKEEHEKEDTSKDLKESAQQQEVTERVVESKVEDVVEEEVKKEIAGEDAVGSSDEKDGDEIVEEKDKETEKEMKIASPKERDFKDDVKDAVKEDVFEVTKVAQVEQTEDAKLEEKLDKAESLDKPSSPELPTNEAADSEPPVKTSLTPSPTPPTEPIKEPETKVDDLKAHEDKDDVLTKASVEAEEKLEEKLSAVKQVPTEAATDEIIAEAKEETIEPVKIEEVKQVPDETVDKKTPEDAKVTEIDKSPEVSPKVDEAFKGDKDESQVKPVVDVQDKKHGVQDAGIETKPQESVAIPAEEGHKVGLEDVDAVRDEKSSSPLPTEKPTSPGLADKAHSPVPADKAPSPPLTDKAPSPSPTDKAPSPPLTDKAPSPLLTDKAPSPPLTDKVPSPTPTDKAPSPPLTDKAASPSPTDKAPSPPLTYKAPSPLLTDKAPSPPLTDKVPSPTPTDKAPSPPLTDKAASPSPTDKAPSPPLTDKAPSPLLTDKAPSPPLTDKVPSPTPTGEKSPTPPGDQIPSVQPPETLKSEDSVLKVDANEVETDKKAKETASLIPTGAVEESLDSGKSTPARDDGDQFKLEDVGKMSTGSPVRAPEKSLAEELESAEKQALKVSQAEVEIVAKTTVPVVEKIHDKVAKVSDASENQFHEEIIEKQDIEATMKMDTSGPTESKEESAKEAVKDSEVPLKSESTAKDEESPKSFDLTTMDEKSPGKSTSPVDREVSKPDSTSAKDTKEIEKGTTEVSETKLEESAKSVSPVKDSKEPPVSETADEAVSKVTLPVSSEVSGSPDEMSLAVDDKLASDKTFEIVKPSSTESVKLQDEATDRISPTGTPSTKPASPDVVSTDRLSPLGTPSTKPASPDVVSTDRISPVRTPPTEPASDVLPSEPTVKPGSLSEADVTKSISPEMLPREVISESLGKPVSPEVADIFKQATIDSVGEPEKLLDEKPETAKIVFPLDASKPDSSLDIAGSTQESFGKDGASDVTDAVSPHAEAKQEEPSKDEIVESFKADDKHVEKMDEVKSTKSPEPSECPKASVETAEPSKGLESSKTAEEKDEIATTLPDTVDSSVKVNGIKDIDALESSIASKSPEEKDALSLKEDPSRPESRAADNKLDSSRPESQTTDTTLVGSLSPEKGFMDANGKGPIVDSSDPISPEPVLEKLGKIEESGAVAVVNGTKDSMEDSKVDAKEEVVSKVDVSQVESIEQEKSSKMAESSDTMATAEASKTPESDQMAQALESTASPEPPKGLESSKTAEPSETIAPVLTAEPSQTPVSTPTPGPSKTPVTALSPEPLETPVSAPTPDPSKTPVSALSPEPSETPVSAPTPDPLKTPVSALSPEPSKTPVSAPTPDPSKTPVSALSPEPSKTPVPAPTPDPSKTPVSALSPEPSKTPVSAPTPDPSKTPVSALSPEPSKTPVSAPTPDPSKTPVLSLTPEPGKSPESTATPEPPKGLETSEMSKTLDSSIKTLEDSKLPELEVSKTTSTSESTKSPEPSESPKASAETPEPSKGLESWKTAEPSTTSDSTMKTPEPSKTPEVSKAPEPSKLPESSKSPDGLSATADAVSKSPESSKAPETPKSPDSISAIEASKSPDDSKLLDHSKSLDPCKSPELNEILESSKSPESMKTTESSKSLETAQISELAKSLDSAKPSDSSAMAESSKTPDPSKTTESSEIVDSSSTSKIKSPEPATTDKLAAQMSHEPSDDFVSAIQETASFLADEPATATEVVEPEMISEKAKDVSANIKVDETKEKPAEKLEKKTTPEPQVISEQIVTNGNAKSALGEVKVTDILSSAEKIVSSMNGKVEISHFDSSDLNFGLDGKDKKSTDDIYIETADKLEKASEKIESVQKFSLPSSPEPKTSLKEVTKSSPEPIAEDVKGKGEIKVMSEVEKSVEKLISDSLVSTDAPKSVDEHLEAGKNGLDLSKTQNIVVETVLKSDGKAKTEQTIAKEEPVKADEIAQSTVVQSTEIKSSVVETTEAVKSDDKSKPILEDFTAVKLGMAEAIPELPRADVSKETDTVITGRESGMSEKSDESKEKSEVTKTVTTESKGCAEAVKLCDKGRDSPVTLDEKDMTASFISAEAYLHERSFSAQPLPGLSKTSGDPSLSAPTSLESSPLVTRSGRMTGEGLASSSVASLKILKEISRSETPGSDVMSEQDYDYGGRGTPMSDSSGQASRAVTHVWDPTDGGRPGSRHYESDEDVPGSPMSVSSHLPSPPHFDYDLPRPKDPLMTSSFYGALPEGFGDMTTSTKVDSSNVMTASMYVPHEEDHSLPHSTTPPGASAQVPPKKSDPIEKWDKPLGLPPPLNPSEKIWSPYENWGRPMNLPSPAPPAPREDTDVEVDTSGSAKTTPKKMNKLNSENNKYAFNSTAKDASNKTKRSESPIKRHGKDGRRSGLNHIYVDLSYVPHFGNAHYANVEFFKRVRARYYVFSGTEPSKDVFNALLEAKQTWEEKDLEVTIIPTYDTDTLGYWISENEETLSKYKIDLSPSASRCTINLQDHDTSCSAYRLEF